MSSTSANKSEINDMLPNRLNFDAIIFCGCTMKELQKLVMVSFFGSLFLFGFIAKALIGMFLIGVALAFPLTVVFTWMGALMLQRIKQGKPKGYLKQAWRLFLERKGVLPSPFTTRSGKWSVGRFDV